MINEQEKRLLIAYYAHSVTEGAAKHKIDIKEQTEDIKGMPKEWLLKQSERMREWIDDLVK